MEIIFRATFPADAALPAGELFIAPAHPDDAPRRDMAVLVIARGLAGLRQGAGPIQRIVVPCFTTRPTFDDMLAAEFAARLAEGKTLPPAASKYATYAGLVREGLQPGDMPLESSMEGIFLAIRNRASGDLAQPAAAAHLLADWQRMTSVIFAAMEAGKDPFITDLFSDCSEFARERAFLKKDHDVYQEDVRRGQQWLVQLPGGPPKSAMLVLDQPRSLLWKYWSRRDTTAPVGGSFMLQVVRWEAGHWAISTDPVQRLPIRDLAERLQSEESEKNAQRAAADPWFDGAPFGHTLVASPKGGSVLSDDEILSTIKRWANAKPLVNLTKHVALKAWTVVWGAAFSLIIGTISALVIPRVVNMVNAPPPAPRHTDAAAKSDGDKQVDFRERGSMLSAAQIQDLRSQGIHIPGYAVIVGVGAAQGDFPALPASCRAARQFYKLLQDHYGFDQANMKLLVDQPKDPGDPDDPDLAADGPPTKNALQDAINVVGTQTGRYQQGSRTNFIFFYGGHGDPRQAPGNNKIGYLVLQGYLRKNPDDAGFDMGYLVKFISERVASSHQLLLVDCCYSGFVINARGLEDLNPSAIYELWKEKARAVITAGTADQQSLEVGPKALFTSNLVKALTPGDQAHCPADTNGDGIVTDGELATYLARHVKQDAADVGRKLTPQYLRALPESQDDVGQFLFVPRDYGQ